jgi:TfoX/Sxy family transcriptional regulator of competence genes
MASDPEFVEYVVDQLDKNCTVTYRKMFGEDSEWLSELVRITARELSTPKPL